jgi:serine/threonine protein kinase
MTYALNAQGLCESCGAVDSAVPQAAYHLPPRTVLNEKYIVGRVIGEGGFGITYVGWDTGLSLRIAVKEYYPAGFVNREAGGAAVVSLGGREGEYYTQGRERFIDEARRLAKFFGFPGIVSVKDFFTENGTAYIVMEYIEGATLETVLNSMGGRMREDHLLTMMKPLINSMAAMHKQGIIHRDIAPDNIIVQPDGGVKLVDFGAAREIADSASSAIIMKHGYAPEEQYDTNRSRQGTWTDVYALCATMYRAIEGEAPPDAISRLRDDAFAGFTASVGDNTRRVVTRGLALKPEDRWPDMERLADELYPRRQAINEEAVIGKTLPVIPPAKPKRRRKFIPAAVVILILVLAAAVTALIYNSVNPADGVTEASVADNEPDDITDAFTDANFRAAVLEALGKQAGDKILAPEVAGIVNLDVYDRDIASLSGIEYFTALQTLSAGKNQLTSLDVSNNHQLTGLWCPENQLTSIDVSDNPLLQVLTCELNPITSVDISSCPILKEFWGENISLTSLDVSNNPELTVLSFGNSGLTSLDISNLTELTRLWCFNNQLTELDVSNNPALTQLWCFDNQLTELNISNNPALTHLDCGGNGLTSLDASNNPALTGLWCRGNQLAAINLSNNPLLEILTCENNPITSLDISSCAALKELWGENIQLTSLDVSNNRELTVLSFGNSSLTEIDVSNLTELTRFWCFNNQLTALDVSNNPALTMLSCFGNNMPGTEAITGLDTSRTELNFYPQNNADGF